MTTIKFERVTSLKSFEEINMNISEGVSIDELLKSIKNLGNDFMATKIKFGCNIIQNDIGLFLVNRHFNGSYDEIPRISYLIQPLSGLEDIELNDFKDYFFCHK